MEYEWDPQKAIENLKKHGVDFADAVISLEDENALTIEDKDHNEIRFKTSENRIRIISARKADKKETKYY
jgi:hypothetical protein